MTNQQINTIISEAIGADIHWKAAKDYCNDLNAMHEAEKVLTADQWYEYDQLMPLRDPQKMHASARQRAEAFLKAIGKWEH